VVISAHFSLVAGDGSAFLAKVHDEIDHDASKIERDETDIDAPGKKYPIFDPNHRRLILPEA
jgi:hypothetical protein